MLNTDLRYWTARIGSRPSVARPLAPRTPVVLVYHGVPRMGGGLDAEVFETHIRYLKAHFDFVALDQLHARRTGLQRIQILLTFDDGFRNNAEVVAPILRRYNVPAIFFVCSRHSTSKRLLWFSYLRSLERWFRGDGFTFRGEFMDMSEANRKGTVNRLWKYLLELQPHPSTMYEAIERECPRIEDHAPAAAIADYAEGMTPKQIAELAADPLFEIGMHTTDHPDLTMCSAQEIATQLADNKAWIESVTGKQCRSVAYPLGKFTGQVLQECEKLGVEYGFSTDQRIEGNPELQIPRVGIYQTSLNELGFKVCWGSILVRLQGKGYFTNN